jgi:hypothetical protein
MDEQPFEITDQGPRGPGATFRVRAGQGGMLSRNVSTAGQASSRPRASAWTVPPIPTTRSLPAVRQESAGEVERREAEREEHGGGRVRPTSGADHRPLLSMGASLRPLALDGLRDPLDPLQPRVPGGSHRGQLGDGAGELRLVHLVPDLASRRRRMHEPHPVEDGQMLRDGLPTPPGRPSSAPTSPAAPRTRCSCPVSSTMSPSTPRCCRRPRSSCTTTAANSTTSPARRK